MRPNEPQNQHLCGVSLSKSPHPTIAFRRLQIKNAVSESLCFAHTHQLTAKDIFFLICFELRNTHIPIVAQEMGKKVRLKRTENSTRHLFSFSSTSTRQCGPCCHTCTRFKVSFVSRCLHKRQPVWRNCCNPQQPQQLDLHPNRIQHAPRKLLAELFRNETQHAI